MGKRKIERIKRLRLRRVVGIRRLVMIPQMLRLANVAGLLHPGLPFWQKILVCRVPPIVHPNFMVHHAPLVAYFGVRQQEMH
jgi:hypothetical protein